jgi:hypothetical protein
MQNTSLEIPLQMISLLFNSLRARKLEIDKNQANSPFEHLSWNQMPVFLSSEVYMFPLILWTSMLLSEVQQEFSRFPFPSAIRVESGRVIKMSRDKSIDIESEESQFFQHLCDTYDRGVAILKTCQFSIRTLSGDSNSGTFVFDDLFSSGL